MKSYASILFSLCLAALLQAQTYAPEDLKQLLAPIALYPDPLIALILPASTVPSDVALAANYLNANGDPARIDNQSWDASVKALAHYPDVLRWMGANPAWTQALGAAFAQQPADVMKSIQQLRSQAGAAGTLVDTPQQQVVMEDGNICIVPVQPEIIYVPIYDPIAVYDEDGPPPVFDAGWPVGVWLGYECDWGDDGIRVGVWHPGWDWRRRHFTGNEGRPWRPDSNRGRDFHQDADRGRPAIPRPRPMSGSPAVVQRPGENFNPAQPGGNYSRPDATGWNPASKSAPNQNRPPAIVPRPQAPPGVPMGDNSRKNITHDSNNRGQDDRHSMKEPTGRAAVQPKPPQQNARPSEGKDKDRDKDAPQH
jgi:hypothetical protein